MKKFITFWFAILFVFANAQTPDVNGIIYVKPTATGTGSGNSWANATSNLQGAIDANGVTKVFVAVGNYPAPANSFVMKNNVAIYGGFDPANNITTLAHSRILPTVTEGGSVLNGENARRVINNYNGTDLNNTAILDGFTITGGYLYNTSGAGIYNFYSNPSFYNLVIKGNSAVSGGGVGNYYSAPVFTNVEIINNSAGEGTGGGMNNNYSSPVLTNVNISNNYAQKQGGAIYNGIYCSPVLTNVKITNNTADVAGGAISYWISGEYGTTTLTNVIIANNSSPALNIPVSNINIRNSIVYGGINGTHSLQYSLAEGNNSTTNGNLNASLYTLNDIFTNPSGGDYTLKTGSPAINAGNNALYPSLNSNTKDLAGNPRLMGGAIDLGVYETFAMTANIDNGIIYVKPTATGNAIGSSWENATNDLHNAIHTAGVQKVFVATGNYNVGANSFVMKNGVEIYGGFNPAGGVTDLSHNRILPTESTAGSVLNGQNERPLIWNNENGLNNTALLDGFTLMNGKGEEHGGAIYNYNVAPTFNNLVIKNNQTATSGGAIYNVNSPIKLSNTIITNNTAQYGGGVRNNGSNSEFTNVIIKNNTATLATAGAGGGGIFNENSALKLTNVLIANNGTYFQGGGFRSLSGNPVLTNVTIAGNTASVSYSAMEIADGNPQINNSIVLGPNSGNYTPKYSMIVGNTDFSNGNISAYALNDVFNNPAGANYTLKLGSPAINTGSNALFTGLTANTKDLAGNPRVHNFATTGIIDMGAYESTYSPIVPTSGIVYVKPNGIGNGSSWANATSDLHTAIQTNGVQKVFVAKGNYNVGANSFIMKNGVEIYGGFDPDEGVTTLAHNRIMPNPANLEGSVLNGEDTRPVIWNVFNLGTAMNNTAILDGFTVYNGKNATGAGIRNVYASPTLRNLVIRGNNATSSGAGIYNENSSPDIYNTVISDNKVTGVFGQSSMGAGIYNGTNSTPTIVNTTITNNQLAGLGANPILIGAGVCNNSGATPKIYNSIIWDNKKAGVSNTAGADIENISATLTLKNSITQLYNTGNQADNNKVNENPMFISATDFNLKGGSPAIHSGSNAWFTFGESSDLAGNQRIFGWVIDMGAYEYRIIPDANGIVYVRPTAQGNGSGTSWNDAANDLHSSIHTAGVTKVFVAVGNYNVGSSSFIMKNGVEIYGGFDPTNGITTLAHNRIMPTESVAGSVLDGQNALPIIYNDNNGLTATSVLDGFTLTNGKGNNGGAIYNFNASPTYDNLVIKNSTAATSGGAIYNLNSPIKLNNTIITGNTAQYGGGVRNNGSNSEFTNIIIKNNTASLATGGAGGGGIFNENSNLKLTNVLIANNSTQRWGGGFRNLSGNPVFTNVTLVNNTAPNQTATTAMEIVTGAGTPEINNSIIYGTITGTYTPQYSLIKTDATSTDLSNTFTNYSSGDYTLKAGSPAINAGDNTLFTGLDANTKDLAGNARVYNFANGGIIDLGAYEYQSGTLVVADFGEKDEIKIYPNPFTDILKISDIKNLLSISVIDRSGRLLKTGIPSSELNLSELNQGNYLLVLTMKDGTQKTFKVIKK